jgi:hypothetical protein
MSASLDLDVIERRAAEATPGPWRAYDDSKYTTWYVDRVGGDGEQLVEVNSFKAVFDADFIAHARADVPALIDEVRRLRAEVADVRRRLSFAGDRPADESAAVVLNPEAIGDPNQTPVVQLSSGLVSLLAGSKSTKVTP